MLNSNLKVIKTEERTYPYLGMSPELDYVVLFTEKDTGMVVWIRDANITSYRVGKYITSWNEPMFSYTISKIELSN